MDALKKRFDDLMTKAATIDWHSLYCDLEDGNLRTEAEGAIAPVKKEEFLERLTSSGAFHNLYSFRICDNANLLEWLSFPDFGPDYGARLTSFLSAIERLGINKDRLDQLAKVYPFSGNEAVGEDDFDKTFDEMYGEPEGGVEEDSGEVHEEGVPQFYCDEEGRIVDEDGDPLVDDEQLSTLRHLLRPRRDDGDDDFDDDGDDDDLDEDDEAHPAPNEPDLSSVEPSGDSSADEAAAQQQLDDLLEQAAKVNWVNLYHDATTGKLLPGHELCMEAGTDPSVILRPKFWSAAAKPDNASWLKRLSGDPSAKPSDNLAQINAVLEAFGIKKEKLNLLASIYPVHTDLKAWWLDFARRHLRK